MTRTLRYLLLFVLTGLSGTAIAQEIAGRVLDENKQPMINAAVQVYQGGIQKGGIITDYDGNFEIKPLEPGYYDVLVLYTGYDSALVTKVVVAPGQRTTQNFSMQKINAGAGKSIRGIVVTAYKKPLVDIDKPASRILTGDEIKTLPTTQMTDVASTAAGAYQSQRGKDVNLSGARSSGTLYVIDGVQVQGTSGIDMAQGAVDQIEVISSGIPANYGDVSGGVINITSRGVASKLTGSVRLQHSIDGYNNNLASFSIAGPLYKKKIDSVHKKPVLGFALSGDYYDDHNRYPTYDKQYVVKDDVMKRLLDNPLTINSDNSGNRYYTYSSSYITKDSLKQVKIPPHNRIQEARLNGKLDFAINDNMRIVAGGQFDYQKQDLASFDNTSYVYKYNLFAADAIPVERDINGRGFIRFTHKFGRQNDTASRNSIISNAYYKLQADYQKTYYDRQDPKLKKNFFDYAYVGKFNQGARTYTYSPNTKDDSSGRTGVVLTGSTPGPISYQRDPDNRNPYLANYTSQYYGSLNTLPTSITTIQGNAIANGQEPLYTYSYNGTGMFYSPGTTRFYYTDFNSNQYALTVDASFDLLLGKTKHAIEFGLYYQQRIEKSFTVYPNLGSVSSASLWQAMRQLVSSVDNNGLVLDKANPLFRVNGQTYTLAQVQSGVVLPSPTDTILYNLKNVGTSTFDKNLRKALHASDTAQINIDALDPSKFSLGMFSADELLNSGNPYVSYYGYTYTGGNQGAVNFNDYWTKKDANGNYTRPIGAFSPNYIAGYILDKFDFKDVHFNIGVRVERYSANTKVLIDPYSLYPEYTVSQNASLATGSKAINGTTTNGEAPGNMGGGYVVYVNQSGSGAPTVAGYRDGNNWYDPTGKYIEDPRILKQYTGGRDPNPYLRDKTLITDTLFNPNNSFTDYNPQVTVMPRLQFSFPISDVANFYAHYDIYAQRPYPTSIGIATPFTYYYMQQNALTQTLANPNLRSQKTFDYEVGFQQKLSRSSSLTLTAFYKERKDMINTIMYYNAYPTTYYTYGNRDFSTTKGSTLNYDLRATNHLTMGLSYTLQFAEGTGSTPQGGKGLLGSLIEAGLPNMRYITSLDYDSRHIVAANIDYRFSDGEGPVIGGMHALQNSGIHLVAKTRSGEPFTRYSDALGNTVIGGVNGSRLPWHFGLDLRIDKDFALHWGERHKDEVDGIKPKRENYIKAILTINNLLNTREILGVYGYTAKPDDNGYLSSSVGKQYVPQQIDPKAFADQFSIYINDPAHLNYARTINFGLEFNF